ncbi:Polygalacturonase [Clostridiales bacterium CHKCI001]|nr:Polygalacturonase [Clostridiales bacterium CHKCI001]
MEIRCERETRNKYAIQAAIDRCPESGGTVIVPEGIWESGPLHLKSNLKLYLEKGCEIRFSQTMEDYLPPVFTRWEGVECYNYSPFIYAKDCHNITIAGPGKLNGQGEAWWPWKKLQQQAANQLCRAESADIPPKKRVFGTREAALRPSFLQIIRCKNVNLFDFTIINGPQWTIHPVYCKEVTARGLTILTEGPNTDGFNPDSCEHVLIENCTFQTGDDCIAVNSGLNEDGWRVNRPCRYVEIRNCLFLGGHAAVAIGSGMSGGVENIWVHHCIMKNVERGIRIKSMQGRGGYVKNVQFDHIKARNIQEEVIQVSMNYGSSTAVPVSATVPKFSDLNFSYITSENAKVGISLCGLPESPIRHIHFSNIEMKNCKKSFESEYTE